jgi:acyl-CoA hydrolase
MEVGVKVWVENYIADQAHHVSSAYLTFVAVNKQGKHLPVPAVIPESEDERRRYEDAGRRREIRRANFERRRNNLVR